MYERKGILFGLRILKFFFGIVLAQHQDGTDFVRVKMYLLLKAETPGFLPKSREVMTEISALKFVERNIMAIRKTFKDSSIEWPQR